MQPQRLPVRRHAQQQIKLCLDTLREDRIPFRRTGHATREAILHRDFRKQNAWDLKKKSNIQILTRASAKKIAASLKRIQNKSTGIYADEYTTQTNWKDFPKVVLESMVMQWDDATDTSRHSDPPFLEITCIEDCTWKKLAKEFMLDIDGVQIDQHGNLRDPHNALEKLRDTRILRMSENIQELSHRYSARSYDIWHYYDTLAQHPEFLPDDRFHCQEFIYYFLKQDIEDICYQVSVILENADYPVNVVNTMEKDKILELGEIDLDISSLKKVIAIERSGGHNPYTTYWRSCRSMLADCEHEMDPPNGSHWKEALLPRQRVMQSGIFVASCEVILHEIILQNNDDFYDINHKVWEIREAKDEIDEDC